MSVHHQQQPIAEEQGPWIIRRMGIHGQAEYYKTRLGGWSPHLERAWKIETEKQAKFILRGNDGEVVKLSDAEEAVEQLTGPPARPGRGDEIDVQANQLTAAELELRAGYEEKVERGLQHFYEAGEALRAIRDKRLYRDKHRTFEEYVRQRWGQSVRHAHRLCDAAEVMQDLAAAQKGTGGGQLPEHAQMLPATESQARELVPVPREQRGPLWQQVMDAAPKAEDGRPIVTAKAIKEAVAEKQTEIEVEFSRVDAGGDIDLSHNASYKHFRTDGVAMEFSKGFEFNHNIYVAREGHHYTRDGDQVISFKCYRLDEPFACSDLNPSAVDPFYGEEAHYKGGKYILNGPVEFFGRRRWPKPAELALEGEQPAPEKPGIGFERDVRSATASLHSLSIRLDLSGSLDDELRQLMVPLIEACNHLRRVWGTMLAQQSHRKKLTSASSRNIESKARHKPERKSVRRRLAELARARWKKAAAKAGGKRR
ncbi:MAG TPA: hypothetical protein VG028_13355 [Terriglobia bacterium]|nr:hypothetical protein [Terriglobia bacterium]